MIDIHSHILPNIDDGAKSMDESVQILRSAISGGTSTIFATPHVDSIGELQSADRIMQSIQMLKGALNEVDLSIRIFSGAELYPSIHLIKALDDGCPVTLGGSGKYVLLGLPFSAIPMDFEQVVFEIQARGITPIIAHPERLVPVQNTPEILEDYLYRGMLFQVNAGSVMGRYGNAPLETAYTLLDHNWVHFLASDVHRPNSKPVLRAAADQLEQEFGEDLVRMLTLTNGERVVNGESIQSSPLPYTGNSEKESWVSRILGFLRRR